jgi:hypothetical protein
MLQHGDGPILSFPEQAERNVNSCDIVIAASRGQGAGNRKHDTSSRGIRKRGVVRHDR